jgi:hypothetical protein
MRLFSLTESAAELSIVARTHREGRSSVSLHDGESSVLRQTLMVLLAGQSMELEHPPVEGWILILEGELHLRFASHPNNDVDVPAGSLTQLPHESTTVTALEDSVILLTVAMGDRPR